MSRFVIRINTQSEEEEYRNGALSFYIILMGAYIILKAYRNSLNSAVETPGGIWNIINAVFVITGVLYICGITKKKYSFPEPLRTGIVYSLLVWAFGLMHLYSFSVNTFFSFLMAPYFALTACAFFSLSSWGVSQKNKRIFFLFFYLIAAFSVYLMLLKNQIGLDNQSDAYFVLCLLPLVLLWKDGKEILLPTCIICAIILMSAKRSGAIALLAAIVVYYIVSALIGKNIGESFKKIGGFIVFCIVLFVVFVYVSNHYDVTLLARFKTLSTDGGSGRQEIYMGIWNAIKKAPVWNQLTGYGVSAITRLYGRTSSAHDDFLEIIYDFGFIACFVFILFYIKAITTCLRMIKLKFYGSPAFAASIVLSLVMSLFSNYAITFTHITGMSVFWGIVLAEWQRYLYSDELSNFD